jgi:hypothetical protein
LPLLFGGAGVSHAACITVRPRTTIVPGDSIPSRHVSHTTTARDGRIERAATDPDVSWARVADVFARAVSRREDAMSASVASHARCDAAIDVRASFVHRRRVRKAASSIS